MVGGMQVPPHSPDLGYLIINMYIFLLQDEYHFKLIQVIQY